MSQWPISGQEPDRGKGKAAQLSDKGAGTSVSPQIELRSPPFKAEPQEESEVRES